MRGDMKIDGKFVIDINKIKSLLYEKIFII